MQYLTQIKTGNFSLIFPDAHPNGPIDKPYKKWYHLKWIAHMTTIVSVFMFTLFRKGSSKMAKSNDLVVTRHPALVDFLRERGVVGEDVEVISHATPEQVRGRHVFGVLPHWLSAETSKVTEVSLDVPAEFRGRELNLEEINRFFTGISTYEVHRVDR